MNKKNKILVAVVVGVLTVGIAFGAFSIAKANNGTGNSISGAGRQAMSGERKGSGRYGIMGREHGEMDDLASFLGIDTDTLESERQSGKSLAEIAKEHNKTVDELKAFLGTEFTNKIDALLKDGKITQEQYDNMKSRFNERIDEMINRTSTGMPEWRGKGNNGEHRGMSKWTANRGTGNQGFHRGDCSGVNNP